MLKDLKSQLHKETEKNVALTKSVDELRQVKAIMRRYESGLHRYI